MTSTVESRRRAFELTNPKPLSDESLVLINLWIGYGTWDTDENPALTLRMQQLDAIANELAAKDKRFEELVKATQALRLEIGLLLSRMGFAQSTVSNLVKADHCVGEAIRQ